MFNNFLELLKNQHTIYKWASSMNQWSIKLFLYARSERKCRNDLTPHSVCLFILPFHRTFPPITLRNEHICCILKDATKIISRTKWYFSCKHLTFPTLYQLLPENRCLCGQRPSSLLMDPWMTMKQELSPAFSLYGFWLCSHNSRAIRRHQEPQNGRLLFSSFP